MSFSHLDTCRVYQDMSAWRPQQRCMLMYETLVMITFRSHSVSWSQYSTPDYRVNKCCFEYVKGTIYTDLSAQGRGLGILVIRCRYQTKSLSDTRNDTITRNCNIEVGDRGSQIHGIDRYLFSH